MWTISCYTFKAQSGRTHLQNTQPPIVTASGTCNRRVQRPVMRSLVKRVFEAPLTRLLTRALLLSLMPPNRCCWQSGQKKSPVGMALEPKQSVKEHLPPVSLTAPNLFPAHILSNCSKCVQILNSWNAYLDDMQWGNQSRGEYLHPLHIHCSSPNSQTLLEHRLLALQCAVQLQETEQPHEENDHLLDRCCYSCSQ